MRSSWQATVTRGGYLLCASVALACVVQPPGHVLDEARLAGAGWALEQDGHPLGVGRLEDGYFIGDSEVERLFLDEVLLDVVLLVELFGLVRHVSHYLRDRILVSHSS